MHMQREWGRDKKWEIYIIYGTQLSANISERPVIPGESVKKLYSTMNVLHIIIIISTVIFTIILTTLL